MNGTDLPSTSASSSEVVGDARVLRLAGQIDLSLTATLRALLDDALARSDDVRVDLSGVRNVDSTAIRELLRAQALAARAGKVFSVVAPSPGVWRLLGAADAAGLVLDVTTSNALDD